MKKKLVLKSLEVNSFTTTDSKKIVGGLQREEQSCPSDFCTNDC